MKKLYLSILLFLVTGLASAQTDIMTMITDQVRQGNAHGLSSVFADNVEIILTGDDKTYTKAEAETALSNFFSKNHPQSARILHKVTSSQSYQYAVLLLSCGKIHYRVGITLKQINGTMQVIEMKIAIAKGR